MNHFIFFLRKIKMEEVHHLSAFASRNFNINHPRAIYPANLRYDLLTVQALGKDV